MASGVRQVSREIVNCNSQQLRNPIRQVLSVRDSLRPTVKNRVRHETNEDDLTKERCEEEEVSAFARGIDVGA